jgi:ABC-type transporter Mla subunit MlaD
MDLQRTEQAIESLEREAQRVSGLGDLRIELAKTQELLANAISDLHVSAGNLSGSVVSRLEALERTAEFLRRVSEESLANQREHLNNLSHAAARLASVQQDGLRNTDSLLRGGLDSIHAQTKSIVREIDQSVHMQLARTLTEYQSLVRGEAKIVTERVEFVQRELQQSLVQLGTKVSSKIWGAVAISVFFQISIVLAFAIWLN